MVEWDVYLAPWINDLVPGTAHQAMLAVGIVEIADGVLVAVAPSRSPRPRGRPART